MAAAVDVGGLLAPVTLPEFLETYWEAQLLHVEGPDTDRYDGLISVGELDEFMSRPDVRFPSIRIVKGGTEIPLERYARELRLGGHLSHDQIDDDKMFAEYHAGATIVLQQLQQNIPGFAVFTNALEASFNCNVHASAFITPPGAQGFTAHYDTYSFIALQLSGSKKWNIYNTTQLPPIRDDRASEEPWTEVEPSRQLVMRRGDLLYVPRGTFHDAETSEEPSIHMTIGFFTPNWIDVAKAAVTAASSQLTLRRSVPLGTIDSGQIGAAEEAIARLDLAEGLRKLQSHYATRRVDVRSGRLLDALCQREWNEETKLRIHPDLEFSIVFNKETERIELTFLGKGLSFPVFVENTLLLMQERSSFVPRELRSTLNEASIKTLCQRLMREGFLTIARC